MAAIFTVRLVKRDRVVPELDAQGGDEGHRVECTLVRVA
jgi:hypothetical protein